MRWLLGLLVLTIPVMACAAPLLFDMGTEESAMMDGYTLVTADSVYTAEAGFGWDATEGMKPYVKAWGEPVENANRGTSEPPPMFTNPLTEDCIVGDGARTFRVDAPAGTYTVYVVSGTGADLRYQYFDFDVLMRDNEARIRFEGSYRFRTARLKITTHGEPIEIGLSPGSKWLLNAVMIWSAADAETMEERIAALEQAMFVLPPEELAQWQQEPLPETTVFPEDLLSRNDYFKGYVVFGKPYTECVYPNTNPYPFELRPELKIFASPGEYEPLTFCVKTIDALPNVRVSVSDMGPVKAETVDIRHVKYMKTRPNYRVTGTYRIVPDVLEPFAPMDLPADETHRCWLTVRIPEDAKPGLYNGSIFFECDRRFEGGSNTEIPVQIRVLDIKLKEDPEKIYGIYYHNPLSNAVNAKDELSKAYFTRKADLEHADMVRHGTRNVTMSAWLPAADEEGNFKADWTRLEAYVEMALKYDFKPPFVVSLNTSGVYAKYMDERYGSHITGIKMPPKEFFDEMTRMAAFVESERVKRGWPEFLYYPIDEPGRDAASVAFMTELLKAIQAAGVKTYVTADPVVEAFEPMGPYVNVWCCQPFNPDREIVVKDMAERDVEYWCYPNHVNGENDHTTVTGARMTYGFGFWRSGFKALIPWIYSAEIGDPDNYLDGSAMDFFNRHEDDGTPVPVAMWEAYREGYDDYRYVYTLETMIAAARQAGKTKDADAAQATLDSVWDAIDVQIKYKYDGMWAPEEFDVYRWMIAREILELKSAGICD